MKFRPVRGGLETAMKELREVNTIGDLMLAIIDTNKGLVNKVFEGDIKIDAYAPWAWPDTRIGWDETYLVTVKGVGPVGYTDGPLEEIRK